MTYEPVSLESLLVHQVWAKRMARRLVREEDEAEDLVQRTWLAALRSPPGNEGGARAWIRKVILNLARERHRRNQVRLRHESAWAAGDHAAPDTSEAVSQAEVLRLLGQQLLALDEPYRSVVVQRYYDGLSSAEISRRIGVPAGTVRWRLKMGLDQLRSELDRRSHGDRSKWVSALLVFAPVETGAPAEVDPGSDDDPGSENDAAPAREQTGTGPGRTGLAATASWIGFVAASALGVYLLAASAPGRGAKASVVAAAERPDAGARAGERAVRTPAEVARAPLASVAPTPSPDAPLDEDALPIVVETAAGEPVPDARLFVAKASGFEARGATDADGRARLRVSAEDIGALGLPATRGRVAVRALATGRVASELVHVAPPFTRDHAVRLVVGGPDAVLGGRVLDDRGAPVPDAVVAWFEPLEKLVRIEEGDFTSPSYLAATTDAEGEFELAHVLGSRGGMLGFAPGHAATWWNEKHAGPDGTIAFRLDRGATVSGRVRFADGRPAAGVSVAFEPMYKASEWATGLPGYDARRRGFSESTRADADGRFRIAGVGAGPRTLWALAEDGTMATVVLPLENGGEATWDAELSERDPLNLRFVDETGRPLAGWMAHARQRVLGQAWWIRRRAADEQGRVVIVDCPDEEVLVDLFEPLGVGASYVSKRVARGDAEHLVQVETRDTSSVSGRILDSQGLPALEGRLVFYSVRSTMTTEVERGPDGEFEQRLAPDLYLLQLRLEKTAANLAKIRLPRGDAQALGIVTAPAMGSLRLDASRLMNGERTPFFALFAAYEDGDESRLVQVMHGELEAEVQMPAFAGRYLLISHDAAGSPGRGHTIEVEPAGETVLDLEP